MGFISSPFNTCRMPPCVSLHMSPVSSAGFISIWRSFFNSAIFYICIISKTTILATLRITTKMIKTTHLGTFTGNVDRRAIYVHRQGNIAVIAAIVFKVHPRISGALQKVHRIVARTTASAATATRTTSTYAPRTEPTTSMGRASKHNWR